MNLTNKNLTTGLIRQWYFILDNIIEEDTIKKYKNTKKILNVSEPIDLVYLSDWNHPYWSEPMDFTKVPKL